MLAHVFGILGELFNLGGAILLAIELFQRGTYREIDLRHAKLHDFAVRSGLESTYYEDLRVDDPDFKEKVAEVRAKRYGFSGAIALGVGFALLVVYHVLEISGR